MYPSLADRLLLGRLTWPFFWMFKRYKTPLQTREKQGLIQGGWIGCLVTPLWVTLSTRTIKHAIHSQGNRAKQDSKTVHMLSEFKGYGNTVGILAHCGGGGTSPFHAPLLNLVLVTPAAKFLDQPLKRQVKVG